MTTVNHDNTIRTQIPCSQQHHKCRKMCCSLSHLSLRLQLASFWDLLITLLIICATCANNLWCSLDLHIQAWFLWFWDLTQLQNHAGNLHTGFRDANQRPALPAPGRSRSANSSWNFQNGSSTGRAPRTWVLLCHTQDHSAQYRSHPLFCRKMLQPERSFERLLYSLWQFFNIEELHWRQLKIRSFP